MITATRYHDISTGHRVHGHESKCAHFHGHNYRFHFTITASRLDSVGRVLDFSVIKSELCMWLEDNWDHKFLLWEQDPNFAIMHTLDPQGVVAVPFNPTAENMAQFMLHTVGPELLAKHGALLIKVVVEETAKCSAAADLSSKL